MNANRARLANIFRVPAHMVGDIYGTVPRMDPKALQPSIDALNAEIQRLTSARDTLLTLTTPGAVNKKRPTPSNARSAAQRKRWAETKQRQRAAQKGTK